MKQKYNTHCHRVCFQSYKHCDRPLSSTGSDDKKAILYGLVITALFFIRAHNIIYHWEVLPGINDA